MGKMGAAIKDVITLLKSDNEEKRFKGLNILQKLKKNEEETIEIDLLVDFVKVAATKFQSSGEEWDDPSFHIIDFISDYRDERLVKAMRDNFKNLSPDAKDRVIDHLLDNTDDTSMFALVDILEENMPNGDVKLPLTFLQENTFWTKRVVEKTYKYLKSDTYKLDLYKLLLKLHEDDVFYQFKRDEVIPVLIEDYNKAADKIQSYNEAYSRKNVYCSWKETYLELRIELETYLNLFEYYYTDELKEKVREALGFNDPTLKARAVITSLRKDLPVSDDVLRYCAKNIESSEMFQWELMRIRKEHKNPVPKKKQETTAPTHLFYHLLYEREEPVYATQIKVIDHVNTENAYSQPVRYYMCSFTDQSNEVFVAWVGAYNLEEGNDSLFMWEGTYTDLVLFKSKTVEQHKESFFNKRRENNEKDEKEIHFQTSTKKEEEISIIGRDLVIASKGEKRSIPLAEIKTITIESRKSGLLGMIKKDMIVIYTKDKKVFTEIPEKEIDYAELGVAVYELTTHLTEPPHIEYLEITEE
ncbi:hypothetical protein [Fictibacillus sp. BK138]|uniref:hypothetical protein n=1 Tax=Fictibacillus sp. BK138 TaxID=2512121 RepID=UPI0010290015|nr:hypothetical protein [Fictibacillus sp. BK138]RZT15535.1 hypothetical protein EV282_3740 [Fictibacillus sp. BK138]